MLDSVDLKNISTDKTILVFLMNLLMLVSPGILWIFYFSPEFFKELDIVKLLVLSSSFSFPVVILFGFLRALKYQKLNDILYLFTTGNAYSCEITFIALSLSYFLNLALKTTILFVIIFSIFTVINYYIEFFFKDLKEKLYTLRRS